MTPEQGIAFVAEHGVVLQAARGPVPSLAEAISDEFSRDGEVEAGKPEVARQKALNR